MTAFAVRTAASRSTTNPLPSPRSASPVTGTTVGAGARRADAGNHGVSANPYRVLRPYCRTSAPGHAGVPPLPPTEEDPPPCSPTRTAPSSRPPCRWSASTSGEIAQRFYGHLFAAHPELLDGTFNRGNQARGEQQQALAGSVAAFATALVETPDRLPESLLSRIAHKHASLGIRPDQYQVVHDNLMWAIVDVLGDAVTPEVAAAWDEVYWLMANALINQERGLYSARGVRPETVWRPWAVEKKIRETADVVTFVVRRVDDRLVKTSLPGQYVTVHGADARRGPPAPPVQPHPRRRRRAPPVHGQAGARRRASPTGRCRRCCTTRSASATC